MNKMILKLISCLPVSKRTVSATVVMVLTLILMVSAILFTGEKKENTLLVVYAQETTKSQTQSSVSLGNEQTTTWTTKETDQTDEMEALAVESVQAMQQDLADTAAREENKIWLSERDTEVLLRIVEAEATDEDITGKMLVANVILNRVNDDEFPSTVEEVVFERTGSTYQFSPIRDGRYYKVSITDSTREAVERVLYGEDYSQGALYFMSRRQANKSNVRWFDASLTWLLEYGTHEFFK